MVETTVVTMVVTILVVAAGVVVAEVVVAEVVARGLPVATGLIYRFIYLTEKTKETGNNEFF
jgi:hypothetical protein